MEGGGLIGRLGSLVCSVSLFPPTPVQSATAVIESEPFSLPCRGGSASQSFPRRLWSNKVPPRQHLPAALSSLCPTGREKVFNTSRRAPAARSSMPANQRGSRSFGRAMLPTGSCSGYTHKPTDSDEHLWLCLQPSQNCSKPSDFNLKKMVVETSQIWQKSSDVLIRWFFRHTDFKVLCKSLMKTLFFNINASSDETLGVM